MQLSSLETPLAYLVDWGVAEMHEMLQDVESAGMFLTSAATLRVHRSSLFNWHCAQTPGIGKKLCATL